MRTRQHTCGGGAARVGRALCTIVPPDLLAAVAQRSGPQARDVALKTLLSSEALRAERSLLTSVMRRLDVSAAVLGAIAQPERKDRMVFDVENGGDRALPGRRVRGEGDPPVGDGAVNDAYDHSGSVYDFYQDVFGRDSIDGQGMELHSSVHFLTDYDNAAWTGFQMIYGDGSGVVFARDALTKALDIAAHEFTHGVVQSTSGLVYSKQPGALNESFADVFGSLVKQYTLGQTAEEADWLIGQGTLGSALQGDALRSMRAPGTAHEFDNQPDHMANYQDLPDDNDPAHDHGGVHINSGIPNRAFYLAATAIGGHAWERVGHVWYVTLTERLQFDAQFADAAEATVAVAGDLYGTGSEEQEKVRAAWQQVGVLAPDH